MNATPISSPQRNTPPVPAAGWTFGPFHLPAGLDILYRGERGERGARTDRIVPLEPRAVQVLRHLVSHGGRVVGKEELLDHVWPNLFVTEGVLKKAVSQIRRALGEGREGPEYVATHHRRGYRFVAPVTRAIHKATEPTAAVRSHELDDAILELFGIASPEAAPSRLTPDEAAAWIRQAMQAFGRCLTLLARDPRVLPLEA